MQVKDVPIDLIISNAGILYECTIATPTKESLMQQFLK